MISGIMLVVPESWFLRPLFRMFGMAPEGPVAGTWASQWTSRIHICARSLLALVYARVHCLCSYMHMVKFCSECISVFLIIIRVSVFASECSPCVFVVCSRICAPTRVTFMCMHVLIISLTGSAVAWAQRRFYGAYIPKGSWFSHLQRAGMTRWANPIWKAIGGSVLAGIGLAGSLFSGCGR